jgi:phosphoglycolate phosphatase-like HAD superfamily hydrolase
MMKNETAKNRLVLFDVDGTLIKQWVKVPFPSARLIKTYFNLDFKNSTFSGDGMTDRQILIEKLKLLGVKNPEEDPRLETALSGYAAITEEIMKKFVVEPIPGVERLIKLLLNKGATLGLLTGNTEGRARIKLEKVGLWHYFKLGAFGQFTTNRSELVGIAINEAKKAGITVTKDNVFVIGDTVRDVQCAKAAGARSIAVATGKQDTKTLAAEKPDFLFDNFLDPDPIIRAIIGRPE